MNIRKDWLFMGGGGGDTASQYRSNVIRDGGSVTDYDYLKSRIQHAKDNGYYDSIVWWGSPSFGVKQSAGLTSKLYDVIDIDNNSLVSTIGSEQPEFISSAQNSKPTLRSDGVDDSMYTTHINQLLASGREFVAIFVFNPISHQAQPARTLWQGKSPEGNKKFYLRQSSLSPNYDVGEVNRNGTDGQNVSLSRLQGIANGAFAITAVNARSKGAWLINQSIGNYFNALKLSNNPLLGFSLFGNYDANSTAFLASKTNYDFYELMLIDSAAISYNLLHDIKKQINDYYNAYTNFEFQTANRLLDGYSNIEGAFSFYNRVTGYSGNCIRLRRSSDNAEQDFGFVSDYIDLPSITTWAGGSNLFVRTWYDQAGVSNYEQATAGLQFQFFTTGGGADTLQPYIKAIAASTTKMTRASTLTSADIFKSYLVLRKSTASSVIWTTGGSTNYFCLGIPAGGLYAINKRASANNYLKRVASNWDANGENGSMAIICIGNNANTPHRDDLEIRIQTYEDTTVDSGQYIDAGVGVMSIGRGNGGASYDGEIYESIVIKDNTHNRATIENNLCRTFQMLP